MELEHQISFVQNVMSPLIGQSYLVPSVSLMHLYFGIRLNLVLGLLGLMYNEELFCDLHSAETRNLFQCQLGNQNQGLRSPG